MYGRLTSLLRDLTHQPTKLQSELRCLSINTIKLNYNRILQTPHPPCVATALIPTKILTKNYTDQNYTLTPSFFPPIFPKTAVRHEASNTHFAQESGRTDPLLFLKRGKRPGGSFPRPTP
jgi:hypothetical protein